MVIPLNLSSLNLKRNLLPSRIKNQIFLGFRVFILLVTRWKITLSERLFCFKKVCSRKTGSFSVYCARNFTAHKCFRSIAKIQAKIKIPTKVKTFLSIGLLQRATLNSCLYCSVVWKLSSQILIEFIIIIIIIINNNNEARSVRATYLKGKSCEFRAILSSNWQGIAHSANLLINMFVDQKNQHNEQFLVNQR